MTAVKLPGDSHRTHRRARHRCADTPACRQAHARPVGPLASPGCSSRRPSPCCCDQIFPLIWTILLSFTKLNRAWPTCRCVSRPRQLHRHPDRSGHLGRHADDGAFRHLHRRHRDRARVRLGSLIDRKFRRPRLLDHDHPDADDAVAGGGGKFLDFSSISRRSACSTTWSVLFTGIPPSSFSMIGEVELAPWAIVIVDAWMWTPYVMLICLAGLRSIPDYIYEAAEVDRASPWRQFWSITLPMALPFIMLAVLFRGIENFKMFDMVNLLTKGGPGSTTELASITLKRAAFEKWRTGYSSAFAIILFVTIFGPRQHLREGPQPGEAAMSVANDRPFRRRALAAREVDRRRRGGRLCRHRDDPAALDRDHRVQDAQRLDRLSAEDPLPALARGLCQSVHRRTRQTPEFIASLPPATTWYDKLVRYRNMVIAGPSKLRAAIRQFADHRLRLDVPRGAARHPGRLCLLAIPGAVGGRSAVLHPVDAHDAADRGRHPDLPDVPPARPAPTPISA